MKGKTQMKIAMIGHKDFPSRSGGVEVVVYELSTRLAARGHEVTVYNRGRQKGHNVYQERNVRVKRIFTFKNSINFTNLENILTSKLCEMIGGC